MAKCSRPHGWLNPYQAAVLAEFKKQLAHMLCEPCPTCEGKGQVKTARSVCYDILREAKQFNPKEFRIIATPAVIEMLLDDESQHLAGLSDFIGKPISLRAENAGSPERYDIVLR